MELLTPNMDKVSGFTFIHNGVEAGYPFVEAIKAVQPYVAEMVVVDMQSTDETRVVLERLNVRIVEGTWTPGAAGECLGRNHALHTECMYDTIWHFEADEVFDDCLAQEVARLIDLAITRNIAVPRLQIEQNFQRCRWYPEYVHRVFKKGTVKKSGHTTDCKDFIQRTSIDAGFLWDATNCFRDNWMQRVRNQAELWGGLPRYRHVPYHFTMAPIELHEGEPETMLLKRDHWTWKRSPFDLPDILKPLVGVTDYREHLKCLRLL